MNSTAVLIAVSYGIVVVIGVALFLFLWRSTRSPQDIDESRRARQEKGWLVVVLLGLLALLFATIFLTPYGESAPPGSQVVTVQAQQFAFLISPSTVRAGRPVEFQLTSKDVNHGFGVYTEDDVFVLQAQVVPDFTTKVVHTFDEPGRYKVLCLEYCGLNHHGMVGQFRVVR